LATAYECQGRWRPREGTSWGSCTVCHDAFWLTAGSAAIDSGDTSRAPVVDVTGGPRPEDGDVVPGAVVDRGAYEYR
jgi:hypothetical protein